MKKINNVLCIFTRALGGKTFSKAFEEYVDSVGYSKVTYLNYDSEIYQSYHPPFLFRLSNALQSAWRIKKKFKDHIKDAEEIDAIYFQAYDLTLPFHEIIKTKYTVLALDSTPLNAVKHNLQARKFIPYSPLNAVLTHVLNALMYKRIFKNIDMFLARTELVKTSLIHDYNIPENKIVVTYLPANNLQDKISTISSSRLELLFVGNDWERKGGDFLLEVFDDECAKHAHLTIVSNDVKVKHIPPRKGLTVINGISNSEVISLMSKSDVFLFPSWRDELGLVLCEALSQGAAVIARESGAQGELVQNGVNGYIFDLSSTPTEWRRAILELAHSKDKLTTYKRNSLKLARAKLEPASFNSKLKLAICSPHELLIEQKR